MTQLQAQVPHPLADNLPCLLTACSMTTPAIRVQFLILVGEGIFKSAAMQIQRHDISSGERALGKIRQKQFVDDTRASDADPTLDCPGGMGCHDEPALLPARAQR